MAQQMLPLHQRVSFPSIYAGSLTACVLLLFLLFHLRHVGPFWLAKTSHTPTTALLPASRLDLIKIGLNFNQKSGQ